MKELLGLLNFRSTLFTTAFFAEHFQHDIKELSSKNEIASHCYFHSSFKEEDLKNSKEKLESIIARPVYGLRMPRMKTVEAKMVLKAGYQYNSSINPTWIPGRYNNLKSPRRIFKEDHLVQFPVSVTPHLRIPLFWLAFKNMPYFLFLKLVLQTLRHDGYLCLYFHPWEFVDLSEFNLPFYLKKSGNKEILRKFKKLVRHLSAEGELITMNKFVNDFTGLPTGE